MIIEGFSWVLSRSMGIQARRRENGRYVYEVLYTAATNIHIRDRFPAEQNAICLLGSQAFGCE